MAQQAAGTSYKFIHSTRIYHTEMALVIVPDQMEHWHITSFEQFLFTRLKNVHLCHRDIVPFSTSVQDKTNISILQK